MEDSPFRRRRALLGAGRLGQLLELGLGGVRAAGPRLLRRLLPGACAQQSAPKRAEAVGLFESELTSWVGMVGVKIEPLEKPQVLVHVSIYQGPILGTVL